MPPINPQLASLGHARSDHPILRWSGVVRLVGKRHRRAMSWARRAKVSLQ